MIRLLLISLFPSIVFATTLFVNDTKNEKIHFTKYKNISVSTSACEKSCQAKDIIDNPPKLSKIKLPKNNMLNPSSYLCKSYNGSPSIYIDEKNAEYSICIFKDKSSFLTWEFINAQK